MDRADRPDGGSSVPAITSTSAAIGACPVAAESVARSLLARTVWFGVGWLAVALGAIGIVLPGLPTTGFMIIAAACFARSSPRFERWVLQLPGVGRSVADYRSGLGMPRRAKVTAVSMMVVAIAISVGLVLDNTALRIVIVVAGLVGTWYIIRRVPTSPPASLATRQDRS